MASIQETSVVPLDEPTSLLEMGHQSEVLNLVSHLAHEGKTQVVILHDLVAAARYACELIALKDGEIRAQGSLKDGVTTEVIQHV